ncbi:MAG TPA: dolichol-phosphate mannosyltransferase [Elusimicrobia bacterium]|nr:dolichol-phosphate mannosyltransferase [Elusimicrobiota bacterium]HBT61771.1 dolichol-phosphate mannosyltransferase [Elusimicrobiota bacterium]
MIHILILGYNEEKALPGMLARLDETLRQQHEPFRFVVVDDGSVDATASVVQALAGKLPVLLLRHETNRGVAKAFDTGLRRIAGEARPEDFIITMEGDGTNDPGSLLPMLRRLAEGYDVVCASRYCPGGAYVGFPLFRRFLSLSANLLTRLVLAIPGVEDYTIFFRGYRAGVVQRALRAFGDDFIESRSFASNAELLIKAWRSGDLRCCEVATIYRYDLKHGKSKMKVCSNAAEYFRMFRRTLGRRAQAPR